MRTMSKTITHSICLQHFRMEFFFAKKKRAPNWAWLDRSHTSVCMERAWIYISNESIKIEYRKSDISRSIHQKGHGCVHFCCCCCCRCFHCFVNTCICMRSHSSQREPLEYIDRILHWWPHSFQRESTITADYICFSVCICDGGGSFSLR